MSKVIKTTEVNLFILKSWYNRNEETREEEVIGELNTSVDIYVSNNGYLTINKSKIGNLLAEYLFEHRHFAGKVNTFNDWSILNSWSLRLQVCVDGLDTGLELSIVEFKDGETVGDRKLTMFVPRNGNIVMYNPKDTKKNPRILRPWLREMEKLVIYGAFRSMVNDTKELKDTAPVEEETDYNGA